MIIEPRLIRRGGRHAAIAAYVPGDDASGVLALCAGLGLDPSGRAFRVAGGLLLKLAEATDRPLPGAVRLRGLADDLLIPADADLEPSLLDDEAAGMTRDRGIVFLPCGRVLAYDPRGALGVESLLVEPASVGGDWAPLPERPALADRIEEIVIAWTPDAGGTGDDAGVGTESPRPEDAGGASRALGRASLGLGKGLEKLGDSLGMEALSALGREMMKRGLRMAPRLSEELIGRQAAAVRDLLRQFREGDVDAALRRSLPIGSNPAGARGAGVYSGDQLPPFDLSYDPKAMRGGGGEWSQWLGGDAEVWNALAREYRKAAIEAIRKGDFRRAAAIYGKLLGDYRSAAQALLRGGLPRDAGEVFLARLDDRKAAARAFEAAGDLDRALRLYRQEGEHEEAGDLLVRLGEHEEAVVEYRAKAAQLLGSAGGHLAAGDLLLKKAGRLDLAQGCFTDGWATRPAANATTCGLRLARIRAEAGDASGLLAMLAEAEGTYRGTNTIAEAGRFYNGLAGEANRPGLASDREELRDRAYLGLVAQLRLQSGPPSQAASHVSALLGLTSGEWGPSLVSDATFAVASARVETSRVLGQMKSPAPGVARVHRGTVSAVGWSPLSGTVFLGFEDGEVFAYRTPHSEVVPVSGPGEPVSSLAASADGHWLAVLRQRSPAGRYMTTHAVQHDGTYRPRHGTRSEGASPSWLAAEAWYGRGGEARFGRWEAGVFDVLRMDSLACVGSIDVPEDDPEPVAGLLLQDERDDEVARVLTTVRGRWGIAGHDRSMEFAGLTWRPATAEGSPLRTVPLSWAAFAPGSIDLAGLGAFGTLHWARLQDGQLVATNTATGSSGGYLAATVVRDGLVAGVTRRGVDWLRCGGAGFKLWKSTEADLSDAVACYPSGPTEELIVVLGGGIVARLPY